MNYYNIMKIQNIKLQIEKNRIQLSKDGYLLQGTIRRYSQIAGIFLKIFGFAVKLEVGAGKEAEVHYVNKKSLIKWMQSNNPSGHFLKSDDLQLMIDSLKEIPPPAQAVIPPTPEPTPVEAPVTVPVEMPIERISIQKGDVTKPQFEERPLAAINAANGTMYYGGGGTNAAFSRLIPKSTWNAAADAWKNANGRKSMDDGEASLGPQIDDTGFFMVQALGPVLDKNTKVEDLEGLKALIFNAYDNSFQIAIAQGAKCAQVPAISTGIYMKSARPEVSAVWPKMVEEAFLAAAEKNVGAGKLEKIRMVTFS
jgi:O-acetyl-ADP-ribose deacetylase (regulator of RNase III)